MLAPRADGPPPRRIPPEPATRWQPASQACLSIARAPSPCPPLRRLRGTLIALPELAENENSTRDPEENEQLRQVVADPDQGLVPRKRPVKLADRQHRVGGDEAQPADGRHRIFQCS